RASARAVVHVDVRAQPVLRHGHLHVRLLPGLPVRVWKADVVDGVLVIAKELAALVEQLAGTRLQRGEESELLVSAEAIVLSSDPVDGLDPIDGPSESGATGVGQRRVQ